MLFRVPINESTSRRFENEQLLIALDAPTADLGPAPRTRPQIAAKPRFAPATSRIRHTRPDDSGNWLDASVLLAADRASLENEVAELRDALAEAEKFIAALQEQLAECQANVVTDADDLLMAIRVIEAEVDAMPVIVGMSVAEELDRR